MNHALFFAGYSSSHVSLFHSSCASDSDSIKSKQQSRFNCFDVQSPEVCDSYTMLGLDPHTTFANPVLKTIRGTPRQSVQVKDETLEAKKESKTELIGDCDINCFNLEYFNQIHVPSFEKLEISRLDPSLALSFYFRTRKDFVKWFQKTKRRNHVKQNKDNNTPLFHVDYFTPDYMRDDALLDMPSERFLDKDKDKGLSKSVGDMWCRDESDGKPLEGDESLSHDDVVGGSYDVGHYVDDEDSDDDYVFIG